MLLNSFALLILFPDIKGLLSRSKSKKAKNVAVTLQKCNEFGSRPNASSNAKKVMNEFQELNDADTFSKLLKLIGRRQAD